MTKVSVVIPVYNQDRFIRDAIDSVLNQTYQDFEIVVINDGSTDKTEEILREYGDKIRWKSQQNGGSASARNLGILAATGEYITFLDSDDMFMPDRLELQVDYLDRHPTVGLVYSSYYTVDEKGETVGLVPCLARGAPLIQRNYVPMSGCMCRSQCIHTVGMFDEETFGNCDWDMWLRISERYSMHRIPKPLFKYRIHSNNTSSRPNRIDYEKRVQITVLKKAYARRGKPAWLKFKIIRAEVERRLWKIYPFSRDQYGAFLRGSIDRALDRIERVAFKLRGTPTEDG